MIPDLAHDRVRRLLDYDPDTGIMTRLIRTSSTAMAGDRVGSKNARGYLTARVDGKTYRVHRLVWFWMTGAWPKEQIDHIDGDKLNNRWSNLREATHSENQHNRGIISTNTSGYKGVYWYRSRGKWRAQISFDRRNPKVLGYFDNIEDAAAAYAKAAREFHGEFARVS